METPVERELRATWQHRLNQVFAWLGGLCPGVVLALGLAFVGLRGADWLGTSVLGFAQSPISPIMVALVLGLAIRNAIGLPAVYEGGLKFCLRHVLRLGIMLLGLRLSLVAVGQIGLVGLPIIVGLHRHRPDPGHLDQPGAGAAAAAGEPDRRRDEHLRRQRDRRDRPGGRGRGGRGQLRRRLRHPVRPGGPVLLSVPGALALPGRRPDGGAVPGHVDPRHGAGRRRRLDVPPAVSASKDAQNTAMVVKLVRNLFMAGVIPLMALLYHRGFGPRLGAECPAEVAPGRAGVRPRLRRPGRGPFAGRPGRAAVPGARSRATWKWYLDRADVLSGWCLATAMAGVGLGTGLAKLRVLGWRPLCVGLAAAALVGGVSFGLITLLVHHST